jgi:hypothetical protein
VATKAKLTKLKATCTPLHCCHVAPNARASRLSESTCSYESAQLAASGSGSFPTPLSTHPAFTPGGRTGAGGGLETPLPSLKKQQQQQQPVASTPKFDRSKSLGGKKLPQNQLLAMQCRTMCVVLLSGFHSGPI